MRFSSSIRVILVSFFLKRCSYAEHLCSSAASIGHTRTNQPFHPLRKSRGSRITLIDKTVPQGQELSGIKLSEAVWPMATLHAVVRNLNTSRPCWRRLSATVRIRSTNSLPVLLCVPKDFLRQRTARRSGRSAALLFGAGPGTRVKVQSEASKLSRFRQALSVFW